MCKCWDVFSNYTTIERSDPFYHDTRSTMSRKSTAQQRKTPTTWMSKRSTAQQQKTPTTCNTTTTQSTSSKKAGPALEMGGWILDNTFAADTTFPSLEDTSSGCAAGILHTAPPYTDVCWHKCFVWNGSIHSSLLCVMRLDAYIKKHPAAVPTNLRCSSGYMLDVHDDHNELRSVCFCCINQMVHTEKANSVPVEQRNKLWVCAKCDAEWSHPRKRCGACMSWKDGARDTTSKSMTGKLQKKGREKKSPPKAMMKKIKGALWKSM